MRTRPHVGRLALATLASVAVGGVVILGVLVLADFGGALLCSAVIGCLALLWLVTPRTLTTPTAAEAVTGVWGSLIGFTLRAPWYGLRALWKWARDDAEPAEAPHPAPAPVTRNRSIHGGDAPRRW